MTIPRLRSLCCVIGVCVAAGCASRQSSDPSYAKLRVEAIYASPNSDADAVVSQIRKQILGAQDATVVRGTMTDAGNPAHPEFGVGDTVYIVVNVADSESVRVGSEAEFPAVAEGNDEYAVSGHHVIVLESGLYAASGRTGTTSELTR